MLAFAAFKATDQDTTPIEVINSFKNFMVKHNKYYDTPQEFTYRLFVFYENYQRIKKVNSENKNFRYAINEFADLTPEEFKTKHTGFIFSNRKKNYAQILDESVSDLPEAVDWRKKGYVNPVKNQHQCGSCWSFSAVASMEAAWRNKTGTLLSLSEQQLVDCSILNAGCQGGLMDLAFNYSLAQGMMTESEYPYVSKQAKCKYQKSKVQAHFSSYVDVVGNNSLALQQAVAKSVVSVAIDASSLFLQFYTGGVIDTIYCGEKLDHGVAVVGYGTSNQGKDYWIVRNSWGKSWGIHGYMWIARETKKDYRGICGILQYPSYIVSQ